MYLKELKRYDFMQFVYFFRTDDFTPNLSGGDAKFTKKVDLLFLNK